jgi:deoxyribose-phosphate aldolase
MLNPQDMQRLIDMITDEVLAAQGVRGAAPRQCSCHASTLECCPDRLRGVLDAGASRIGVHASGGAPGGVAGLIDHTLLKPDATRS